MTIYIDDDELYPHYEAYTKPEYPSQIGYEISDSDWAEYQDMYRLFVKWQAKLRELSRYNPE